MTARANSLTDRARAGTEGRPLASMIPFFDAFARLGYDRAALMRAAGVSAEELRDPDARLPDERCHAMFREAHRQRSLPNLALRLAAEIPIGAFPLLDYIILTSDTVGAGMRHLPRYMRLIQSSTEIRIREDGPVVRMIVEDCGPFGVEFGLALPVFHFRRETDGRFRARELRLRHRPEDPPEFERLLGCRVAAGAASNELVLGREVWALPLRRRDTVLHGVLRAQADGALRRLSSDDGLVATLRRVLVRRVAGGDTRLESVAREVGASARTLQRTLEGETLSYQKVLDQTRRHAAESYLQGSNLSCAEIGYLLGFSEPAAFTRAFKRWRGVTPREYRSRESREPSSDPAVRQKSPRNRAGRVRGRPRR